LAELLLTVINQVPHPFFPAPRTAVMSLNHHPTQESWWWRQKPSPAHDFPQLLLLAISPYPSLQVGLQGYFSDVSLSFFSGLIRWLRVVLLWYSTS
jgi:hypothetical protein